MDWLSEVVPMVEWPDCSNHGAAIETFVVSGEQAMAYNLRCAMNRQNSRRIEPDVTYRKLYTVHAWSDGKTWRRLEMSDTPAERRDHAGWVGDVLRITDVRVLVNGLGLGVVVNALLRASTVQHVTVVEINPWVIGLVKPLLVEKYGDARLTVIEADALQRKPTTGERYDAIWHDIWPDICTDNKPEYTLLHRRWGKRVRAGLQDSWVRAQVFSGGRW